MANHLPRILVLGATGMVGRAVFQRLQQRWPRTTLGTGRNHPDLIPFESEDDASALLQKSKVQGPQSYVINCIGQLRTFPETPSVLASYQKLNHELPQRIAAACAQVSTNVIHVSTDAVFAPDVGEVNEKDAPHPTEPYGVSKLAGESPLNNVLNIRTSFLGLNTKGQGLLALAQQPHPTGYINQNWSGCTTLQFAEFCERLIASEQFSQIRQHTHVLHFAPLGPYSKYEVVATARRVLKKDPPAESLAAQALDRVLTSQYELVFPPLWPTKTPSLAKAIALVFNTQS